MPVHSFLANRFRARSPDSEPVPPVCAIKLVKEALEANVIAGYAAREGGYCDGVAPERHAGALSLWSATVGRVTFRASALEITVKSDQAYSVLGRDLNKQTSYRLDGSLSDAQLTVDLAPSIQPLNLSSSDIGLYAWRDQGSSRVYAPIWFEDAKSALLELRSPSRIVAIRSIKLCLSTNVDNCLHVGGEFESSHQGGSRVLVTAALPRHSGLYQLSVQARDTRGNPVVGLFDLDMPNYHE